MKYKNLIVWIVLWALIISTSCIWNYYLIQSNNSKVVINKAQSFFHQIVSTRLWNSMHGGVYVPVTKTTQPNPYLIDSLRDVTTQQGLNLTKINPSFMTRQISEINNINYNVQFHITSLNPLRPENEADSWEKAALELFEKDRKEIFELVKMDSTSVYRYMSPLITRQSCLKCHAIQGYKLGEVRGGISIQFPSDIFINGVNKQLTSMTLIHVFVLCCGIFGFLYYYKSINKYFAIIKSKNEELSNTIAIKDKFFSIVAHDLRNPFISILGYIDILKTEYKTLSDDEREKFMEVVYNSTKSSFKLLDNLQLWAKSQRANININRVDVNLVQLVNEAIKPYLLSAEMKKINVFQNVNKDFFIQADKFTMERVIANLFSNAVKFTPKFGEIEINATLANNTIECFVKDNGVGIAADNIDRLFSIEHAFSTKGTDKEEGTGLGLILCKDFIIKNNGKIGVESHPDKGSKFYFSIQGYVLET